MQRKTLVLESLFDKVAGLVRILVKFAVCKNIFLDNTPGGYLFGKDFIDINCGNALFAQ